MRPLFECLAIDVSAQGKGHFAAGQHVHGIESEVRSRRHGADRSKQVGIEFHDATGVGNEVAALDDVRGRRSRGCTEKVGGGEPDFPHGRRGQTQSVGMSGRAVRLAESHVHHGPRPFDGRRRIREIADRVREAVVDLDLQEHPEDERDFAADFERAAARDAVGPLAG